MNISNTSSVGSNFPDPLGLRKRLGINQPVVKKIENAQPSNPRVGVSSPSSLRQAGVLSTPKVATNSGSLGQYKGVDIIPGTQEQIMAQMRAVDSPAKTTAAPVAVSPTINRGLVERKLKEKQPKAGSLSVPGQVKTPYQEFTEKLASTASGNAVYDATKRLAQFRQSMADQKANLYSEPVTAKFMQGRGQVVQQANLEKESALAQGVANELAARGQDITALTTAAGLAAPQVTGYGQTVFDPIKGQFVGGGGGLDPQIAASQLAKDVISGTKTYEQAAASLGYAGAAGQQFLNQAIEQQSPGFNIPRATAQIGAQAQSIGQTGTLGGQLTKQANTVKEHMSSLLSAYQQLGSQFGLPVINRGVNAIKEAFGSGPLQAYEIALQNVRDELAKILGGGSATEGSRLTARELLPDNMSPAQIQASIAQAIELMDSKIAEYTRTPEFGGAGTVGAGSTTGGLFDW